MDKGFARCLQRTNAHVLRKEISFLVKLLKQNFIPESQGSTLPLNPLAEALSQHLPLNP